MSLVRDDISSIPPSITNSSAQDASTSAAPKQLLTTYRAQKRKACDVAEDTIENPDVWTRESSMSHALTKSPQFLYTVAGEAVASARSSIQASGALWSTDAWLKQPSTWKENKVSVVDPTSVNTGITRTKYDKAFCAEWISNSQLAVSTKCGHVLRVDRKRRTYTEVELVGRRWVEPPIITEEDLHRYRVDRGGIHSLHANRSKHLLACSGCRDDDNNVYVLDLLSEKWRTVKQGRGHRDWVFTLSWISDHAFVTGGRDKMLLLWNPQRTDQYVMEPVARYDTHLTKVCSGVCLATLLFSAVLHAMRLCVMLCLCDLAVAHRFHAMNTGEVLIV
jgi:WD40 repeat protein